MFLLIIAPIFSGRTARFEWQYVAEVNAGQALGREVGWRSLQTMCFCAGDIEPLRALSIITGYRFRDAGGLLAFDRTHLIDRRDTWGRLGQSGLGRGYVLRHVLSLEKVGTAR